MTYLPEGLPAPVPSSDGLDAPFWAGTRAHQLRVQRCAACATWRWGPEWVCHRCRSFEIEWPAVVPQGTIFSWERVWHPAHVALADAIPYLVVLVELTDAGNVRFVGNLLGDPRQPVQVGQSVRAVFEDHDDTEVPFTLVHWEVA